MTDETTVHIRKDENPDSIEIGTPSKGGALKVYFDATHPDSARAKIDNAIALRAYMNAQCTEQEKKGV